MDVNKLAYTIGRLVLIYGMLKLTDQVDCQDSLAQVFVKVMS